MATKRAYPKIARDLDAIVIILTDEDLYSRSLRREFTYAFHSDYRFAVVSTRRMNPAFRRTPPDDKWRLAATHQMLTDYVAFLYFHVPRSSDPTSIMYQPFTPDGGPDNLYQSDIHSEESANGLRGDGYPCLTFTYSYETAEIVPRRFVNDCYENAEPRSTQQETFQIELAHGQLVQRSLDFQIDSLPPIDFRRAYLSQYTQPMAFGLGSNHKYNNWLLSDGAARLSFIDIVHEDGNRNHLARVSSGIGFSPCVIFENRDDAGGFFGARMTWDSGHFKLAERDGSWFTYRPCSDSRCFWIGYSDAQNSSLKFERDAHLALQRLTASDGQGIQFQSDGQARILEGKDTKGNRVPYTYDPNGRLGQVNRADGKATLYTYDSSHRMTAVAVIAHPGAPPHVILTNEYDSTNRIVTVALGGITTYRMDYIKMAKDHVAEVSVTDPSGKKLDLTIRDNDYTAKTTPVRFPALFRGSAPPR